MAIAPTDEMTNALTHLISDACIAAYDVKPFSNGDVIAACMHVLVEAGMSSVEAGKISREKMSDDLCCVLARMIELYGKQEAMDQAATHEGAEAQQ